MWKLEPVRISFLIKSVYECLPTKKNLKMWRYGNDDRCGRCQELETLEHVLIACKVALSEGRYTWRHNKVLECIAEAVKVHVNQVGVGCEEQKIEFIREE